MINLRSVAFRWRSQIGRPIFPLNCEELVADADAADASTAATTANATTFPPTVRRYCRCNCRCNCSCHRFTANTADYAAAPETPPPPNSPPPLPLPPPPPPPLLSPPSFHLLIHLSSGPFFDHFSHVWDSSVEKKTAIFAPIQRRGRYQKIFLSKFFFICLIKKS